ncbi:hypothetical protein [Nocardiopsis chromatogenes]|uniref:hypothetical protein n=1 Tax=Nocardiopsis chromatogenes TaxID=280239 RepID=UPI00034DDAA0|nr:hypothetical protein [Nocardiopsis chromatogenes]
MRPAVAFAAGVLALLAGCASPQSAEKPDPEPATSAPDTSSAEERALEAYEGMMGALVEASLEGATENPEIDWYAKGQAADLTQGMLIGVRASGEPKLHPEVDKVDLEADPPAVIIEDCVDGSDWQVVEEDVKTIKGNWVEGEGPRPYTATVTEEDGSWMVEKLWLGDYGDCQL